MTEQLQENQISQQVVEQAPVVVPKNKSKLPVIILLVIIILLIGVGGVYARMRYINRDVVIYPPSILFIPTAPPQEIRPTEVAPTSIPDPTANWKIYTNSKYSYSLKYPTDWTLKEELSFITIYNYDVNKVPGKSYDPKTDGDLFKIDISIDKSKLTSDAYVEKMKKTVDPVTDKPYELLNIKQTNVSNQIGTYFETKDSLSELISGEVVFNDLQGQLFVFAGGLNYEANKNYFDQILSTFKFTE